MIHNPVYQCVIQAMVLYPVALRIYKWNQVIQMSTVQAVDALLQLHTVMLFGFSVSLSVQPRPLDRVCGTQFGIAF